MSWPPRDVAPAPRARRALLLDVVAALIVAVVVLQLAAGLGVVAFFGVPLLLLGLIWIGIERLVRRNRQRGSRAV